MGWKDMFIKKTCMTAAEYYEFELSDNCNRSKTIRNRNIDTLWKEVDQIVREWKNENDDEMQEIKLKCCWNNLKYIPENLPEGITVLNCAWGQLTSLPETLPSTLKELNCCINRIIKLPDNLPTGLLELYCDMNRLTELPVSLPSTLTILSCSDNEITSIPESITRCQRLRHFNINDNPIEYKSPAVLRFIRQIR